VFADAIEKVTGSIFPILMDASGPSDPCTWGIAGTGFFVSDEGLFVTALHVFTDAHAEGARTLYAGNVPDNWFQPEQSFVEEARDERHDLFLGRITSGALPGLRLARKMPPIGTSVCLSGYPVAGSKIYQGTGGAMYFHEVTKHWQPTRIIETFERDTDLGIEGFITEHLSLSGMSGGPVFGVNGTVYGLAFENWIGEIEDSDGNPHSVNNAAVVDVRQVRSLIEGATGS
jgi:S1-C subfamily serine protease